MPSKPSASARNPEPAFKFKAIKDATPKPPKWPSELVLSIGMFNDSPWAGIGADAAAATGEMCEHVGADLSAFNLHRVFKIEIS